MSWIGCIQHTTNCINTYSLRMCFDMLWKVVVFGVFCLISCSEVLFLMLFAQVYATSSLPLFCVRHWVNVICYILRYFNNIFSYFSTVSAKCPPHFPYVENCFLQLHLSFFSGVFCYLATVQCTLARRYLIPCGVITREFHLISGSVGGPEPEPEPPEPHHFAAIRTATGTMIFL